MFKNVKKILVIKFRHIGDVLLTIPAIKALKETFPDASISVIVNSGTEDVLTGIPFINEVMVFDRSVKNMHPGKRYMKELVLLKKIRSKGFDMTVALTKGDRAAIMSFLSGARYRLAANPGKKGIIGKRYLYTHLARIDKQKHMVLQNLDVVGYFGITTDNKEIDFFIPRDEEFKVKKIFKQYNIKKNDHVVHVHTTSRWLFKCWKDEYIAEVVNWLINNGLKVVVTSAPDDKELKKAKKILSLVGDRPACPESVVGDSMAEPVNLGQSLLDLCGKTSIKELAAISKASDLFIGIDSAPMHIAAAVGTPVIALFGPTEESLWGPFGSEHIVISKNLSCKPCKKGMCDGIPLRECMTAIKPDDVKKAISRVLKSFSASNI
jgi:heptosyltransferase-3